MLTLVAHDISGIGVIAPAQKFFAETACDSFYKSFILVSTNSSKKSKQASELAAKKLSEKINGEITEEMDQTTLDRISVDYETGASGFTEFLLPFLVF